MPAVLPLALAATLIASLGGGCAINPVSGRPEVALISVQKEREIGREEAQKVAQEQGLVGNKALGTYVQALGRRVAEQSPRQDVDYTFGIVDQPEPNAFALPGGYVYVTRGLLALLNSEDELACVLGHEIGHVAARHSVQQISRAAPLQILTGLPGALAGIVSPRLGATLGGIGEATSAAVLAPFSRDQENQADQLGQDMAAAAGWDPAALSSALDTLGRQEQLSGRDPGRTSFFDTHPSTPERVASTRSFAAQLQRQPRRPLSRDPRAFLRRLDGLVIGQAASEGVFNGPLFLHPDLGIALRFPEGWKTANGREQAGAVAPEGVALITLEAVAQGNDPLDGARALEKATGAKVAERAQRVTVGGLRGARAQTRAKTDAGEASVELGWIAYGGGVFQLMGLTSARRADEFRPVFNRVLSSFRPLTAAERSGIREVRLRLVEAAEGERLDALVARTGSAWAADMVAAANGLPGGARLRQGQLLKIAVSEPYSGSAGPPAPR